MPEHFVPAFLFICICYGCLYLFVRILRMPSRHVYGIHCLYVYIPVTLLAKQIVPAYSTLRICGPLSCIHDVV